MKFEIGKYYKHTNGRTLYIITRGKTHMWWDCLIAEEGDYGKGLRGNLIAAGE